METDDRRRSGCVPRRALLKLRLPARYRDLHLGAAIPGTALPARALRALQDDDASRELSAILITEIAIKSGKGKLDVRREDVVAGLADLRVQVLPWNARHALQLFALPPHHADPFDGPSLAQALAEKIPVVASDREIPALQGHRHHLVNFAPPGIAAGSSGG